MVHFAAFQHARRIICHDWRMKSFSPCLAVILAGVTMMIYAAVGLAMQSDSRGGRAVVVVPKTSKAPPPPVVSTSWGRGTVTRPTPSWALVAKLPERDHGHVSNR
jgi:hypothetical protein